MGATFQAFADPADYAGAVEHYLEQSGTGVPIPVLTDQRPDLERSIQRAAGMYIPAARVEDAEPVRLCAAGDIPEPVLRLVSSLPAHAGRAEDGAADGEVLVGVYEDLSYGVGTEAVPRILTGRDLPSLSWMVAKQLAVPRPGPADLVVSDLDDGPPLDGHAWIGPDEIRKAQAPDFSERLLGSAWRRALFHGNGAVDSSNLGTFTLCGRFSPIGREPLGYGPSCHFGQGCYKPEEGVIPVGTINAAELALLNCFSGASAPAAIYSADYNLLLAAVDGPAQRVIFTMTACDAGRPEILAWAESPYGALARMERSLADINPFPALAQVGLD